MAAVHTGYDGGSLCRVVMIPPSTPPYRTNADEQGGERSQREAVPGITRTTSATSAFTASAKSIAA